MVFEVVFRGLWDVLTDPEQKIKLEEMAWLVGIFLFFEIVQWLTLKCHRKGVRYIPLILMTILWGLTEYLVAAESSMGAAVLVLWAGYPVVLGWTGTICACVIWHIRKLFHKTA